MLKLAINSPFITSINGAVNIRKRQKKYVQALLTKLRFLHEFKQHKNFKQSKQHNKDPIETKAENAPTSWNLSSKSASR